jgi:hypothetical protein
MKALIRPSRAPIRANAASTAPPAVTSPLRMASASALSDRSAIAISAAGATGR